MKCPQRVAFYERTGEEGQDRMLECLKEECAWWNQAHRQCDPSGLLQLVMEGKVILEVKE